MSPEKIKTSANVAGDQQLTFSAFVLRAFMKLFLSDGFVLDTTVPDYRDQVLTLGKHAEAAVLEFLVQQKFTSRGAGAVLKHLRILHRSGVLNAKIEVPPAASVNYGHPRFRTWTHRTFSSQ
ncbi:hypothetical protein L914_01663 [Phytophthora nicotianae]|uniref:Uncharacterized protein n=1 Tax=Phytophthora nicotianae TaxID=4792 RepID=W2P544_PHYNI|nr:hypothetical protein L914_01663 [Phytophthora nicotianae]